LEIVSGLVLIVQLAMLGSTDPEMQRLIGKRLEIQNEIAGSLSARKSRRLKEKLDKVIAQQMKLMPDLKKRGEEILNGGDNTE